MFRAFDENGSGGVSYEQFNKSIEFLGLDIDESDQRLLFNMVDTNGNNSIDFKEFSEMFEAEPMRNSFVDTGNCAESLKARPPPLNLSPRTMTRIKAFQEDLAQKLLKKHVSQQVAYGFTVLLNAFRHMDNDGDGCLTYDELKNALGREMLDLDIDPNELDAMVTTIDSDKNGLISFKEFISYFSAKSDGEDTDIILSRRKQELEQLGSNANQIAGSRPIFVDFDERKPLDPLPNPRQLPAFEDKPGCMQERLCRTTLEHLTSTSPPKQENQVKKADTSSENIDKIFSSLGHKSHSQGRRKYATIDWERIGVGGNGVDRASSYFMPESDRFVTTHQEQFSPVTKDRMRVGTPQHDLEKKQKRLQARNERTYHNMLRMQHNKEYRIKLSDWGEQSRLRIKAKQRYGYNDQIIKKEEQAFAHKSKMAKKPGGASFHRMWAGSLESQFNSQPWGVTPSSIEDPFDH
ncbi:hypothetical protein Ae201684_009142 [Aphanomyces euteiches]|uniref:EF-hand domain-containing protein n=2 Tax=Aphanomyces euteiches TaxID=100861 RepID=A0A6G0X2E0_9STRA|nr:hypothetical protein Ae201684_009142 [Aphanomyces euteiches]